MLAEARFVTEPESRFACVIVYDAVHVIEAPGASDSVGGTALVGGLVVAHRDGPAERGVARVRDEEAVRDDLTDVVVRRRQRRLVDRQRRHLRQRHRLRRVGRRRLRRVHRRRVVDLAGVDLSLRDRVRGRYRPAGRPAPASPAACTSASPASDRRSQRPCNVMLPVFVAGQRVVDLVAGVDTARRRDDRHVERAVLGERQAGALHRGRRDGVGGRGDRAVARRSDVRDRTGIEIRLRDRVRRRARDRSAAAASDSVAGQLSSEALSSLYRDGPAERGVARVRDEEAVRDDLTDVVVRRRQRRLGRSPAPAPSPTAPSSACRSAASPSSPPTPCCRPCRRRSHPA